MKLLPIVLLIVAGSVMPLRGSCQTPSTTINVALQIPCAPSVLTIGGVPCLYYELRLTNLDKDNLQLTRLSVISAADSALLIQLDSARLSDQLAFIGALKNTPGNSLPPGRSAVIYLEVKLPPGTLGQSLFHRLELKTVDGAATKLATITGGLVKPLIKPVLILGRPLKDGPWAAVYDPHWPTGHRRVYYTVDSIARIPGRYAIDFMRLDQSGKYAGDDPDLIKNWFGYSADVLAVADGEIATVKSDAPEFPSLSRYQKPLPENGAGNYISLKTGDGQYVFYEHLKPGSIKVRSGEKVKKGQIIAALGFTGQSTGPHLHLHVAGKDSPLGAEGIPFEFEHYWLLGAYPDFGKFGNSPWSPRLGNEGYDRHNDRPAPNSVILFSEDNKR